MNDYEKITTKSYDVWAGDVTEYEEMMAGWVCEGV
jgi:hypothetical protein